MAKLSIYGKFNRQNPLRTFVSTKSNSEAPEDLEGAMWSTLLGAIRNNAKTIEQLKEEIWNAGIKPSDSSCTINSMEDTKQLWSYAGEPFKIFFVNAANREEAIQIENEILKYERSLSERQRFVIIDLTEDDQNSVEDFNFSEGYEEYKTDIASSYFFQAFDEAEDADRRKKQDLSYAWARLFLSPSFWFTLGCLLLGACALTHYLDPLALAQGTNGAMIWNIALSLNVWIGSFIFGGLMVYSIWKDYQEFKSRINYSQGIARTSHSYLSDVLDRLRNWFVDHKLQVILIGIGLVGSVVALTLLLVLGIDFPPFHFIIQSLADTLDFGLDTAGKLLNATQLFEILFVLAPLGLGFLAKNAIAVHEARVSNDEGKVSEIRLLSNSRSQQVQVRNFDEQTWIPLDLSHARSASNTELGPFTNVFFHGNTFAVEDGNCTAQLPISDCYRTQTTPIWK